MPVKLKTTKTTEKIKVSPAKVPVGGTADEVVVSKTAGEPTETTHVSGQAAAGAGSTGVPELELRMYAVIPTIQYANVQVGVNLRVPVGVPVNFDQVDEAFEEVYAWVTGRMEQLTEAITGDEGSGENEGVGEGGNLDSSMFDEE